MKKNFWPLIAGLIVLALIVTACAPAASSTQAPAAQPTQASAAQPTAAAAQPAQASSSGKTQAGCLPCVLDLDASTVPNFAWSGYTQPLPITDAELAKLNILDAGVGRFQGKVYSLGQFDRSIWQ
jgi:hypothetical protein